MENNLYARKFSVGLADLAHDGLDVLPNLFPILRCHGVSLPIQGPRRYGPALAVVEVAMRRVPDDRQETTVCDEALTPARADGLGRWSECKRIANGGASKSGRVRMKANANLQISARSRIKTDPQDRPDNNF